MSLFCPGKDLIGRVGGCALGSVGCALGSVKSSLCRDSEQNVYQDRILFLPFVSITQKRNERDYGGDGGFPGAGTGVQTDREQQQQFRAGPTPETEG